MRIRPPSRRSGQKRRPPTRGSSAKITDTTVKRFLPTEQTERLKPSDYVGGRLTITSRKGASERGNEPWKGKSKRTIQQRRCDKADRLFEKLVKGTAFERLDGYHALPHWFISTLVARGKTWDRTVAFVGHLDQRTTQRYTLHAQGHAGDGGFDSV